jgi:hypothetical protein
MPGVESLLRMIDKRCLLLRIAALLLCFNSCCVQGNYASSRLMTGGSTEFSRTAPVLPTSSIGLNGSGEVLAIADTGLDFDHCMFWQEPFPFPCFSPKRPMLDPTIPQASDCAATTLASIFAEEDFLAFVTAQLQPSTATKMLLDSGRTKGTSRKTPPMDADFASVGQRISAGYQFSVRGAGIWGGPAEETDMTSISGTAKSSDAGFLALLSTWGKLRPILLDFLGYSTESVCPSVCLFVYPDSFFLPLINLESSETRLPVPSVEGA